MNVTSRPRDRPAFFRLSLSLSLSHLLTQRLPCNCPAILQFYKSLEYKQRTDVADALAQGFRRLQRKKCASTIEALRELTFEDNLEQYSTEGAHPDELVRGFKKRKYGETDRPSRASLAFNE